MINKRSNNLCDIYMLPLVGLNPSSFGIGNFINSYIAEKDQYVVARLRQMNSIIRGNPYYRFDFSDGSDVLAVFEIPKQLRDTIALFRDGKYSKFSDEAKIVIRKKSGLLYRSPGANGRPITAKELLALDKAKELREDMERSLNEKISPDAELASIPGEENFYDLKLSNQLVC